MLSLLITTDLSREVASVTREANLQLEKQMMAGRLLGFTKARSKRSKQVALPEMKRRDKPAARGANDGRATARDMHS